ncbi:MAG: TolC family protein, partial [Gemmatimonadaceae bacterium]|nr:TolC family protein [Chitinophagaceae bacterium]
YSANARPLFDTGKVVNIREKLVELAMQNPEYEIADRRIAIAHYQLAKAKGAWLGQVIFQANFNEYSIKPSGSTLGAANLFPRYNVGISLPLDLVTNKGNEVKIARQNLGMMQAEKNQRFRTIKGDVLKKYEAYLLHKQKLDLQSQSTLDAYSVFLGAEKDYSDGIIKQEDYNKATKDYNDEKAKQLELIYNFNVAKIELEIVIGVPLETVITAK